MASRRGPDNSARVAISGTANVRNWANVFHVQFTTSSSISQADLDAWLVSFANQYKTSFASQVSNSAGFVQAKATLYTPGGGVLQSVSAMTGNGTGGTIVQDNSASAVVSWLSTVYWRGGKPRTYLPTVPNTFIQNASELTSTAIGTIKTAATGFRTAINALTQGTITSTVLGMVSFQTGGVARSPAVFFSFTGASVHKRLGTQRRRLGKWEQ